MVAISLALCDFKLLRLEVAAIPMCDWALKLRVCRPAREPRLWKFPQVLPRVLSRVLSEIGVLLGVLPRVLSSVLSLSENQGPVDWGGLPNLDLSFLWETDFYTPPVLGGAALLPFSAPAVYTN